MNGFTRWMMKHPHLAKWFFGVPISILFAVAAYINFRSEIALVVCAFISVFITSVWIDSCYALAANKATKHLNKTCDYEPLLALTEEIVRYAKPSPSKQVMQINYAVCHLYKGDFLTAKQIMSNINIDQFAGALYYVKMTYYNNLAEVEDHLGNKEAADVHFDKLDKMYRDLKPGKKKEAFKDTFNSTYASYLYRKGDYDAALKIMDETKPNNLCAAVQNACLQARILIALGQNDRAREALNFAITNGNKLYAVAEARELLSQIA